MLSPVFVVGRRRHVPLKIAECFFSVVQLCSQHAGTVERGVTLGGVDLRVFCWGGAPFIMRQCLVEAPLMLAAFSP